MIKFSNYSILAGRIRVHVKMNFNKSATEITEYTECWKRDGFYSVTSVRSVADFLFIMGYWS